MNRIGSSILPSATSPPEGPPIKAKTHFMAVALE